MKIYGSSSVIVALSANNWWERSPHSGDASYFCFVGDNGNADFGDSSTSRGVSFGFCV